MTTIAYGVGAPDDAFERMEIPRREPGPTDVVIDIQYCGICHSDLHTARGEWGRSHYPCVPGHEIVGSVRQVGEKVSKFKIGQSVGVGCMVDSCRHCASCEEGEEQYCENGFTGTYNGRTADAPGHTMGGYSTQIVVDQAYVLSIAHPSDQLAAVAPLLCAGVTTYSPLKHWSVGPGTKVGIVGIGGLGHMGVKLAHAMGAHVVAFTTSEAKREAAHALGAAEVVISKDKAQMKAHASTFDLILNTVAASHDLDAFSALLRRDGTMVLVGLPEHPHPSPSIANLIYKRRAIAGSLIGSIAETQEMLDFCAQHGIVSDIEQINASQIDEAYDRMARGDVKYRFVIDNSTMT